MPLDLATAVTQLVPLLGALGVAGVITAWYTAGKDRRTARAAMLTELGAVEAARWATAGDETDISRIRETIRKLETAALIARVPRKVIVPYAQLATAALWHTSNQVGRYGPEGSSLPAEYYEIVQDAASIVSRAAWSSPATRWIWLHWQLRKLDRGVSALNDASIKAAVENARTEIR